MRHITYTDTEFDYFRTILKTPRRSIRGKIVPKKQRTIEFPTKKVSLNESCLIIDKEDNEAKAVKEALIAYGFDKDDIFIEKTGSRAMQTFLSNENIKIVITDLHIAEMNGLEIIKAIRTNHMYAQVNMVILSDKISKQVVEYAAAYKSYVMAKPFSEDRLVQLLDSICKQAKDEELSTDDRPDLTPQEKDIIELKSRIAELEELLAQATSKKDEQSSLS